MKANIYFDTENNRYRVYMGDTVINTDILTINEVAIDKALSSTSENAVQNKIITNALNTLNTRIASIINKGTSVIAGNDISWEWDDALTGRVGHSSNFNIAPNTLLFIAIPKECHCNLMLNGTTNYYTFGDDTGTETQLGVVVTDANITDNDNFSLTMNVGGGSDYMDIRALVEANTTLVKADYPNELKDIRIDTDGKDWSSAGDAVRGQVNRLNTKLNNIYNAYEYIELEKEEITEADYGFCTPAHPIVGQTLGFTADTSGNYANLKYDISDLAGKDIIVQGIWISWVFACAIVDENNKVLAVPDTQTANSNFTWFVQIPAKAKYLYINSYMFGLGRLTTDISLAKYAVIKPLIKNNLIDLNIIGNTEKYKNVSPLTVIDNYAISHFNDGEKFNTNKVYNNENMQFKIYSCKAGEKWHISTQNNYAYDGYTILDLTLKAKKTSRIDGQQENIDEIIEIQNDGYIIFQCPKTLTNAFIRRSYKYTSDKRSISGLKVAVCGDSIMAGANGTAVAKLLSNDYDIVPQSLAVSGAQMTTVNPNVSHICEQVQGIDADTDIIILEGGINDYWSNVDFGTFVGDGDTTTVLDTTTFCGALETAIRWIRDNRPHIPVLYVLNHHIASADYGTNTKGQTFQNYRDMILQASQNYGFTPVRVDLTAFNTTITQTDYAEYSDGGAHPTDKGYRLWYLPLIVEAIQKSIG